MIPLYNYNYDNKYSFLKIFLNNENLRNAFFLVSI